MGCLRLARSSDPLSRWERVAERSELLSMGQPGEGIL